MELISVIDVPTPIDDIWSWIPRSITSAKIVADGRTSKIDLSAAATLPPHRVTLNIKEAFSTSTWPSLLSPSMTKLTLKVQHSGVFLPSDIALLPRSLTHLSITLTKAWSYEQLESAKSVAEAQNSSLWPPTLTALKLSLVAISTRLISLMPRTLLSLRATIADSDGVFASNVLPPSLTQLVTNTWPDILAFEGPLPRNLSSLKLLGPTLMHASNVNSGLLPNIVELAASLPEDAIFSEAITLSRHLRSLLAIEWPLASFRLLPSTLTSLSVAEISVLPSQDDEPLDLSPFLPLSLTKLDFGLQETRSLAFTSFSQLTRLKHLKVESTFTSGVLRHLPRTLNTLYLELETLLEVDVPFIPPLLDDCNFEWRKLITNIPQGILAEHWPLALWMRLPQRRDAGDDREATKTSRSEFQIKLVPPM